MFNVNKTTITIVVMQETIRIYYFLLHMICIRKLILTTKRTKNNIQEPAEKNEVNIFFDWPQFGYCDRTGQHDTFLSVLVMFMWFIRTCLLNKSRRKEIKKDKCY